MNNKAPANQTETFSQNRYKRAVLYARVSSDDTRKDGRNLTSQLDMCRQYATEHTYIIIAELHEDDRGASGASFELPQLSTVLAMAERKEFDVLVVRELDRLSRNLAKQLIVEESLRRNSVTVEYVLAEYDDTPEGRLQKHIRATVAEYEREKIKERSVRGRRNVVRSGKVMTAGNPPYGYRLSEDGKSLVVYEPEAKIVGLIFGWYVDEQIGYGTIAKRLTDMGVQTWVDARPKYTHKKRRQAEWSNSSVGSILKNQTYIGKWHYCKQGGGSLIEVRVPTIITDLLWKQAQYIREEHSRTSKRNTKHEYLMQHRLTCACTYAIQAREFGRKDKQYPYYYCPSHNGNNGLVHTKCGLPYYRADYVDRVVWDWLVEWFRDPDDLQRKLEVYQADREKANAPIVAALKVNDDLIAENQRQLDRLLDAYQSGVFALEAVTERKHRLDETIAALSRERGKLQERLAGELTSDEIQSLFQFSSELSRGLDKMSKNFAARRKVIEMLDVRGILVVEGNERVCNASFILGEKRLVVNSGQGDSTF